jgi:hypothetical protein
MRRQAISSTGTRPKTFLDEPRLRAFIYQPGCEHSQLRLPMLNGSASGTALAANPKNAASRRRAHKAWRELLEVIGAARGAKEDEEVLENAEGWNLLLDVTTQRMLAICSRLKELEGCAPRRALQVKSLRPAAAALRKIGSFVTDYDVSSRPFHLSPQLMQSEA